MRTRRNACLAATALLAAAAATLSARDASAEVFRYTDRSGRVHLVPVGSDLSPSAAGAPPEAPAPLAVDPSLSPSAPASPSALPLAARAPSAPASLLPVAFEPVEADPGRVPFYDLAAEAARLYSLPVELILAVMKVESGFNPRAVSRKGALGLMQLMPATAASIGVVDAFDPRQNVMGGALLLRTHVNAFDGQVSLALAAYNAGAGAVRRAGGVPPIAETLSYVPTVLSVYRAYVEAGVGRAALGQARAW